MKFLESIDLEYINQMLDFETSDSRVFGRIEPYSCKPAGVDKKLFKQLELRFSEELMEASSISPEVHPVGAVTTWGSPFGSLDQSSSRKLFYYLISTLNASFPDYDFSDIKPDQFIKHSLLNKVIKTINQTLISAGGQDVVNSVGLWDALNFIIELEDSEIYSYVPDMGTDPLAEEGSIWSFNYFFFNRKLKRIILFTCQSVSLKAHCDEGLGSSMYEDSTLDDRIGMTYDDLILAELEP